MFKFLKDKIKSAVSSISKDVEEEIKEDIGEKKQIKEDEENKKEVVEAKKEEHLEQKDSKKGFFSFLKRKKEEKETKEEKKEEAKEETKKEKEEAKEEREAKEKAKKEREEVKEAKEETKKEKEETKKEKEEAKEEREAKEKAKKEREEVKEAKKEKEEVKETKGFFSRIKKKLTYTRISEEKFETLFWNLEMALMEANVAVEVIEKIKEDLKKELVDRDISRGGVETAILNSLKTSVENLFEEKLDLVSKIKSQDKTNNPFIIAFVGINGVGKTTSLAKVAKRLEKEGLKSVIAAADTFRVAAIEQLGHHAENLKIKMIKHDYGADPAAVCYDAVEHAKAKNLDVVLIDTAGRNNVNENLLAELKKIIKVAKPNLVVFVGDSLTGNDMVEQAQVFNDTVGIDAIILSKADVDEKGGGAISVSYITHKPIIYLGIGQNYEDLIDFSSKNILENLGLI